MKDNIDPKMHSAEHILNQTMVRAFNCGRCFSAHIEKKKSKCDYFFKRNLAEAEVRMIEMKVNEIIKTDLPVIEKFISKTEAEKKYDLSRLSGNNADEMLRIILIGDFDACPCSGPHVSSTAEIGNFRIISTSEDKGILRIRYRLD